MSFSRQKLFAALVIQGVDDIRPINHILADYMVLLIYSFPLTD